MASDHALRTQRLRDFPDDVDPAGFREAFEGEDTQRVAAQNRDRLAEGLVRGGFPPSEIVVVHAGKIIVDEGEGVQHLYGGAGEHRIRVAEGPAARFMGGHDEGGPDPLSSGK
jgi:hypothetical protein